MTRSIIVDAVAPADQAADRLMAEATNCDLRPPEGEPRSWWVLIVRLQSVPGRRPLIWISRDREPLDRLIAARRFERYDLEEVAASEVPAIDGSARDLSVSYLRDRVPGAPRFIGDLIDAGHLTLGDLIDAGADRLFECGLSVLMIQRIRRKLATLGLRLGPMRRRSAA